MKNSKVIALIAIGVAFLTVCLICIPQIFGNDYEVSVYSPVSVTPPPENVSAPDEVSKPQNLNSLSLAIEYIIENKASLETSFNSRIDKDFLSLMAEKIGDEAVESLANALENGKVKSEDLLKIIGYSEKALLSLIDNDLNRTTILENTENGVTDLVFVGDVSFSDGYSVMNYYNKRAKGAEGLVSEEVLGILRSATVAMANNEFTLTTRGKPIPNKIWTFRGKPENVSIYHEMGIDIVGLANNHAFDYGPDSLTDTLATLDGAGIARLGAGENLEEAKAPYFYIVNGIKIAIVAGSAIDPYSTRGARENQSGVFQIFDTVSMSREITAAKEKADYVIAYVHWGIENTTNLTGGQKSMGKAFVDAGADVVIGMHSHCMQGVEYYKGKLIVYSLGNFTFSSHDLTCSMLKTSITPDGEIKNVYYPMMQKDNFTYINSGEAGKSQFELLKSLLINTEISDDYVVTEIN
ncbi:MAG: CapA family protein [Clostridia bacterium]|nr:CapA family protein [Clostridia bacterium]